MSRSTNGFCHGLCGAVRSSFDPHALQAVPKLLAVDAIAVAEEIGRRGLVREGVHELLSRPGGRGMLGDVEVDDSPAVVSEHHEDEEDAEASGRHG
jgi:hypothetical protein